MPYDDPASTNHEQMARSRFVRSTFVVIAALACSFAASSLCSAQAPARRIYSTAPTAYRRPVPNFLASPSPHYDAGRMNPGQMNAEADIPQSHLLYSLHAPPQDNVIYRAGGKLETSPTQEFGVVTASGPGTPFDTGQDTPRYEFGPGHRHEPVFEESSPFDRSTVEHIPPSPSWATELSLSSDLAHSWARLRDDTYGVFHPNNVLILALAGGGALALRDHADSRVRAYTAGHENRWGNTSKVLGEFGYLNVQVPALLGTYFWSVHTQNEELHDVSTTTLSALTISGFSTLVLKVAANTGRPSDDFNGGQLGFPSYHTASSFTIASVLDEYYGHRVGIPAYTFAGLIAWSRIDQRDHDLSDIVFGSVLGFVIGKSVAQHHLTGDSRVQILPWFEPIGGTTGLQFSMVY